MLLEDEFNQRKSADVDRANTFEADHCMDLFGGARYPAGQPVQQPDEQTPNIVDWFLSNFMPKDQPLSAEDNTANSPRSCSIKQKKRRVPAAPALPERGTPWLASVLTHRDDQAIRRPLAVSPCKFAARSSGCPVSGQPSCARRADRQASQGAGGCRPLLDPHTRPDGQGRRDVCCGCRRSHQRAGFTCRN
jgi:hypothetical protein